MKPILPMCVTIALILAAAGSAAPLQIAPPPDRSLPPILRTKGDTVRVQLFDARSGVPIANTGVVVSSDNGIRCVRAPCPTNAQSWTGKSDAKGIVAVPTNAFQAVTSIATTTYASASLIDDAEQQNGLWVVDLIPKSVLNSSDRLVHRFKLIDASTNKAIVSSELRVSAGARGAFDASTSPRGYLFIPDERVASDLDRVWVVVPGYERTRLDFGAVRYRTRLKPR
jgi:hypothetical protein